VLQPLVFDCITYAHTYLRCETTYQEHGWIRVLVRAPSPWLAYYEMTRKRWANSRSVRDTISHASLKNRHRSLRSFQFRWFHRETLADLFSFFHFLFFFGQDIFYNYILKYILRNSAISSLAYTFLNFSSNSFERKVIRAHLSVHILSHFRELIQIKDNQIRENWNARDKYPSKISVSRIFLITAITVFRNCFFSLWIKFAILPCPPESKRLSLAA